MKNLKFLFFVIVVLLISCEKSKDGLVPQTSTEKEVYKKIIAATASSTSFTVTSDGSWTASSDQSWLKLNTLSGTGPGTLNMSATKNTEAKPRNAIVTITCGEYNQTFDLMVTQETDFDFTISHLSGSPTCNVGPDNNNPLAPSFAPIALWYIFGSYETFTYQTIQIESTIDPAPLTFDHIDIMYYNSGSDWLDYSYDSTTKLLSIWAKSYPGHDDWAVISLTSGSVFRNIAVGIY